MLNKGKLNEIIENACAHATAEFNREIEAEFSKLTAGNQGQWNTSMARCQAVEKALPTMLKTALSVSLTELLEKIDKER